MKCILLCKPNDYISLFYMNTFGIIYYAMQLQYVNMILL